MTGPKLLGARPRVSAVLQSANTRPFTPLLMAMLKDKATVSLAKTKKKKGPAAAALSNLTGEF